VRSNPTQGKGSSFLKGLLIFFRDQNTSVYILRT
jgi:hypothetical protein